LTGSLQLIAIEDNKNTSTVNEPKEHVLVITGTSKSRVLSDTPQSVTQINSEQLSKLSFSSQADVLRYVPGIKTEGGGGEVATNLQVRGLPSAGQFQFTPLLIDGSPSLSIFGLNSSAFDVYFRNDLGIEKLEFIRGGVSNLFGPGSVAGVINYISKKGTDFQENIFQIETAEEGKVRADFVTNGPTSTEGTYYAFSGFYRYDEGPLKTGFATDGYQLRGNIHKEFNDNSGSLTVYTQLIDDKVQFYLPLPLDAGSKQRIRGNDGTLVHSVQTDSVENLTYPLESGSYTSPIDNGVWTKGVSLSLNFDKELADDWSFTAKSKWSKYKHQFNLFLDGDGVINIPENQSDYLVNRELGSLENAVFTYVDSGQVLAADDLLFANRLLDRNRPVEDFSSEFNFKKNIETENFTHDLTLGVFISSAEADDQNIVSAYLAEFNNRPRLVNLEVNGITVSRGGIVGPSVGYNNKTMSAVKTALYFADQFENEKWIFDLGVRFENIKGKVKQEQSEVTVISNDPLLAPNLQSITYGSGNFVRGKVSTTDYALSGAALYRFNNNLNLYANLSRGYFFPEVRSVRFDDFEQPQEYEAEIIKQGEIGIKYFDKNSYMSAALFFTDLENRNTVDFVNDGSGGVEEITITQSTEATGLEFDWHYTLTDSFSIQANLTYQDHQFTKYEADPSIIGNELRRKPKILMNLGAYYDNNNLDASILYNFHGDNYANDSNSVKLDSFNLFNFNVGYTWHLADEKQMRVGLSIFNLTDSQGITEGSPRLGNAQNSNSDYFVGRPILPRRISLKFKYNF